MNAFEIRVQACQQRHEDHLHVYLSPYISSNLPFYFNVCMLMGSGLWERESIQRII